MFWGRAYKKMAPVCFCFDHQFGFLLISINALTLSCWALITHSSIALMVEHPKYELESIRKETTLF